MKLALHVLSVLLVISTASSMEDNDNGKCTDGLVDSLDVIPFSQRIVGECTANTNMCPTGLCILGFKDDSISKGGPPGDCLEYGVVKPETVDDEMDCDPFGTRQIKRITHCVCKKVTKIDVTITVTSCKSKKTVPDISIYVNGKSVGQTDTDGTLSASIPATHGSVAIYAEPNTPMYKPSARVIDIPLGAYALEPIYMCVHALATPVNFESTKKTQLSISNDPSDVNTGVGNIFIGENSLLNPNGIQFNGKVNVHVNYINVAELYGNDDAIPGRFLTTLINGDTEPLTSGGMFALTFTDESKNLLQINKPLTIEIQRGFRLWKVNPKTAIWEDLNARRLNGNAGQTGRSKRQIDLDSFEVYIANASWVNIDKIPGAPKCYFKTRVFKQDRVTELVPSNTPLFSSGAVGYTLDKGQRLRFYLQSTKSPDSFCNTIRCPVGDDSMIGLINMTSTDNVLIGNSPIPIRYRTFLEPKQIKEYSPSIKALHQAINYTISSDGKNIIVSFTSDVNGPLYKTEHSCQVSGIDDPAFHFIMDTPPNFEPYPKGTKLCTARVALVIPATVIPTLLDLPPPKITAVSLWTDEDDNQYFFTDSTEIDLSTLTAINTHVVVCITYRCSKEDSKTRVYLIVVSPDITQSVNGIENVTAPAISCQGKCDGDRCMMTGIDGAFDPPTLKDDTDEPRYYAAMPKKCKKEVDREKVAFVLYCKGQQQLKG